GFPYPLSPTPFHRLYPGVRRVRISPVILDEIYKHKLLEVEESKERISLSGLEEALAGLAPTRDFEAALRTGEGIKLIAEIKAASPSLGVLREGLDPVALALEYQKAGATAISVLTDQKFFHGSLSNLERVRKTVDLPLLRKDFIIDGYQLYEARVAGADAVLLIARLLDKKTLSAFLEVAGQLGLACLVEVHTEEELKKVLDTHAGLIGINNRDLDTFKVDLNTTLKLLPLIPVDRIVVSESGIHNREDVRRLEKAGVKAILVGEALVRSKDVASKIKELLGSRRL
ncbi:MAG: indole-3-glycerol phosphate synthase TrpC, partial [Planctomycetota bacterium]